MPCEPREDVYFNLGKYQPFRGMVPTLVWYKNARVVLNFLTLSSFLCPVGGLLKEVITVSFLFD